MYRKRVVADPPRSSVSKIRIVADGERTAVCKNGVMADNANPNHPPQRVFCTRGSGKHPPQRFFCTREPLPRPASSLALEIPILHRPSRTHLFVLRDFARIRRKECENGGWRFSDARAHRARGFARRARHGVRSPRALRVSRTPRAAAGEIRQGRELTAENGNAPPCKQWT